MIVETEVKLTPKQLAEQFWEMHDDEQVEFFTELFNVAKMDTSYHNYDSQAYYIHKRVRENGNKKAKEALMCLAAPFYLNVLRERYTY